MGVETSICIGRFEEWHVDVIDGNGGSFTFALPDCAHAGVGSGLIERRPVGDGSFLRGRHAA